MIKLEQRLIALTKRLAVARESDDVELIEQLEDEIDEIEFELEQQYYRDYSDEQY